MQTSGWSPWRTGTPQSSVFAPVHFRAASFLDWPVFLMIMISCFETHTEDSPPLFFLSLTFQVPSSRRRTQELQPRERREPAGRPVERGLQRAGVAWGLLPSRPEASAAYPPSPRLLGIKGTGGPAPTCAPLRRQQQSPSRAGPSDMAQAKGTRGLQPIFARLCSRRPAWTTDPRS